MILKGTKTEFLQVCWVVDIFTGIFIFGFLLWRQICDMCSLGSSWVSYSAQTFNLNCCIWAPSSLVKTVKTASVYAVCNCNLARPCQLASVKRRSMMILSCVGGRRPLKHAMQHYILANTNLTCKISSKSQTANCFMADILSWKQQILRPKTFILWKLWSVISLTDYDKQEVSPCI